MAASTVIERFSSSVVVRLCLLAQRGMMRSGGLVVLRGASTSSPEFRDPLVDLAIEIPNDRCHHSAMIGIIWWSDHKTAQALCLKVIKIDARCSCSLRHRATRPIWSRRPFALGGRTRAGIRGRCRTVLGPYPRPRADCWAAHLCLYPELCLCRAHHRRN